jgi:hypothetical protein
MPTVKLDEDQTTLDDLVKRWDSYTTQQKKNIILRLLANRDKYLALPAEAQAIVNYETLRFMVNQLLP